MYEPQLMARLRQKTPEYRRQKPGTGFQDYINRLSANMVRIRTLMGRLYGHRPDFEQAYWALLEDMFEAFRERPEDLRKLDLKRETEHQWLLSEGRVGMMLYVDRFAGDLQGLHQHIDYLQELGVNWVHLMPLLKSPPGSNDGGYAVSDYRAVDPRFGSMEQLEAVCAALRERDIWVTLDLVMNHTSDQHRWAEQARQGDPHYQQYYYLYPDRHIPDQFETSLPEVFPESSPGNFSWIPEIERWAMTVFHHYQWDLNYTEPIVFREVLKVLLFLANRGVDILRLDAVAFTWKQIGTSSQNLPEAHTILQLMKACAQVVAPGVAFIAEAIVAPQEVIRYFGEGENWGRECEIAYHATFMALLWDALATTETKLLRKGLQDIPAKPQGTTWINYLRCHDDIGLGFDEEHIYALGKTPAGHKGFLVDFYTGRYPGSDATGAPFAFNPKTGDARISGSMSALVGLEKALERQDTAAIERAIARIGMLHAVILAYGGLPLLYYGDEVGTLNNYAYLEDPDQAYDNRWMHRPIIDWEQVARRKEAGTVEERIFQTIQRLIYLRKASPEFADQNTISVLDTDNDHIFAFWRWNDEGARTLVVANFHDQPQSFHAGILVHLGLEPANLMDKISGQPPLQHVDRVEVPPYGAMWLTELSTFLAFQKGESVLKLKKWGLWG